MNVPLLATVLSSLCVAETELQALSGRLASVASESRTAYAACVAGQQAASWWTAVIITASSARQADRYREEIRRRREQNKVPAGIPFLVVPDPEDQRVGSGGATINALRALAQESLLSSSCDSLQRWWAEQRVFMIHSGGDSRRLPQQSLAGKLFSALPLTTPWGEPSTVFDELLSLSTAWLAHVPSGLLVSAGDVLLVFDAAAMNLQRPGVSGVAVRQPIELASQHGVYLADDTGRVHGFLQKPSAAELRAAGGLLTDNQVALDAGLIRFDPEVSGRLTELAGVRRKENRWTVEEAVWSAPFIDLYRHVTFALTGQWKPAPGDPPAMHRLFQAVQGTPFWCSVVDGEFIHVGTTRSFRRLFTEETELSRLFGTQCQYRSQSPPGVQSDGVILDSLLAPGSEIGSGALVLECDLAAPVRAARGAMLQGLSGLHGPVEVPEDTVLHQVPLRLKDGRLGVVVRVYDVSDDPKASASGGVATWLGQPMLEKLAALNLDPDVVWDGIPLEERSLWTAKLFPLSSPTEAWNCARWMLGQTAEFSKSRWDELPRFSLAGSTEWADAQAAIGAQSERRQHSWQQSAVELVLSGADVRPLLASAPSISCLAATGHQLAEQARQSLPAAPTESASFSYQASSFFAQAGLIHEAEQAREEAFLAVQSAVGVGLYGNEFQNAQRRWCRDEVTVSAPPRIDFGGGWSDTPPFCLDWGGTVLNMAVKLGATHPIRARVKKLDTYMIRCISEETNQTVEYRSTEELLVAPEVGSPFSIPREALQLAGIVRQGEALLDTLRAYGGGLEITLSVELPLGSGLGTSSILGAAVLRALAEITGLALTDHVLSEVVLLLEQRMTTGGGWQDQVGGIFPGAKLISTGPGLRQRLRVEPLQWSRHRQAEFRSRFLLYFTGTRRIAKDLLRQVVSRYLAREAATVQVLHSIKTLAAEMAYAMRDGEWEHLGWLMDRHWQLNQVLDPHTTSAPISAALDEMRPYLAGAKLAGAGGGGFFMLLAKDAGAANDLRAKLSAPGTGLPGKLYEFGIADEGLVVE